MSSDSKAASLAARLVQNNNSNISRHDSDEDEALFAELEEEIENASESSVREHGLQVLKAEMERMSHMQENKYGIYSEINDEKQVVHVTAREPRCVVHFYHSKFRRCEIMDKHLTKLAVKYHETRFFRVFVENVPWLVEKLFIQVLPCVICFVGGIAKDRKVLVGFEELGNGDSFSTSLLELRLSQSGVLQKASGNALEPLFTVSSRRQTNVNDDEVFDLDD